MFSAPPSAVVAGLQAIPVAALLLFLGYLLADALVGKRDVDEVTRWGLAFPALMAFCLALMLLHIGTDGAVFGSASLVRALLAGTGVGLLAWKLVWRRRVARRATPRVTTVALVASVVLTAVVWSTPSFRMLPQPFRPDIRIHAGRAHQLLSGDPLPTSGIIGDVPNDYPWLYHAVLATTSLVTPGGRALGALHPLLLLQVCGAALALFALGRWMRGSWQAGALLVLFGALAGGFGYLLLEQPDLVQRTRAATFEYMGDLIPRRSPNGAFHNLAPTFPRDVGFALAPAYLLLLVIGWMRREHIWIFSAGTTLGMMGLTGPDAFVVALLAALFLIAFPMGWSRMRLVLAVPVTALAVYATWVVPLFYNYFELGGFRGLQSGPLHFTPVSLLFAWGLMTPFALLGLVRFLPRVRVDVAVRVAAAMVVAALVVLAAASLLPRFLGDAFTTLGYTHRYWPVLYLGLAPFAALGAAQALEWLAARRRALAIIVGVALVALAVPSSVLGSIALPSVTRDESIVHAALTGGPDAVLNVLAPQPGRSCRVAVPEALGVPVFAYTGYSLVLHPLAPRPDSPNRARIRWRRGPLGLANDVRLGVHNEILTQGTGSEGSFRRLLERYDLDRIVVPSQLATLPRYRDFPSEIAAGARGRRWTVLRTGDC